MSNEIIQVWMEPIRSETTYDERWKVVVSSEGDVQMTPYSRSTRGFQVPENVIDDLIAALRKAQGLAPKIAEAHQCEKRAEEMVKQAKADRLAAILRGEFDE